jgi:ribonuclease HI
MLDQEQQDVSKNEEESSFKGFWRMSFDGACSSSGNGVGIVLKGPNSIIYPHTIRLEFPCMNDEVKYEALIQGMILGLEMSIENLIITGNFELVINHITQKYKIKNKISKLYEKK